MTEDRDKIVIEVDESDLEEEKLKKKTIRVLVFSLGGENYCVGIKDTKEVIRPSQITRVPNAPEFVTGITNLRGEIVTILDVRHFFGLGERKETKEMNVIITDITGGSVGIVVDKVLDTLDIEEEAIQPPLATIKGKMVDYTKGQIQIGGNILILLDLKSILTCDEIERLKKGEEK